MIIKMDKGSVWEIVAYIAGIGAIAFTVIMIILLLL